MHFYAKIKEKRDKQMEELEKIYDKILRMQFLLAKDSCELINLWKSIESLKAKEQDCVEAWKEELSEMDANRE